ncbi:DUF1778 domain-containing protein [Hahella sp. KA22]|uniref:type II toxin-antitoxin system TacA family antitoxin n=1 Tax=unclassified Hahella TaxID=2624107 RepID=UPI000FDE8246|nr:DUF1778 domain-containing protein [Hahella sp. KA22]AZZ94670.1 DUF1778 domain-containing protein [Hahella sp. KA22]QAY58043.1 DUF1778 domain-containing protein [Hahella sp. KA22]
MQSLSRMDLRLDPEIKKLASRASALSGSKSLSEFVIQAIREKSLRTIEEVESLKLSNRAFDDFWAACQQTVPPNDALVAAKRRLNKQVENGEISIRTAE